MLRWATTADSDAICAIYNPYVDSSTVTFEVEPVSPAAMAARIAEVGASQPWIVSEVEGQVVGYAYASPWKGRCAYRYSVEATIYLRDGFGRRGLGTELYAALVDELRGRGLHAVIGGIALPNAASVGLHEKLGFRKVAHFEQVGWKLGRWIDVGYWQLLLDGRAAP